MGNTGAGARELQVRAGLNKTRQQIKVESENIRMGPAHCGQQSTLNTQTERNGKLGFVSFYELLITFLNRSTQYTALKIIYN